MAQARGKLNRIQFELTLIADWERTALIQFLCGALNVVVVAAAVVVVTVIERDTYFWLNTVCNSQPYWQ